MKMRYWLVKHDKESIKTRPGWIWREVEGCSRVPQNYRRVKKEDKFILYAHETSGDMDSERCYEIYGFYEVTRELKEESLKQGCHWTITGRPLPKHKQGWVQIPHPTQFFEKKKFNQQSLIELKRAEFERFLREHEKFVGRKTWAIFDREPKNEQEVVALFVSVMHKCGYKRFEKLGTRTPDAILVRNDGRKDKIEFEYRSSGLALHKIEQLRGVKCICWINDLDRNHKYSKGREILPLREKLFRSSSASTIRRKSRSSE